MTANPTFATAELRAARDFLLDHRDDYAAAVAGFEWPRPRAFNWGLEWFDVIADERPDQPALVIAEEDGSARSYGYAELSARSDQLAGWLAANGVRRGERILLMLGTQVELWEMILAAIKLGAVIVPVSTELTAADLADRMRRCGAGFVVARDVDTPAFRRLPGTFIRIAVGRHIQGWIEYDDSLAYPAAELAGPAEFKGAELEGQADGGRSRAEDPLIGYFTSGVTGPPAFVEQNQVAGSIGHLSTMYWIGLRPGDVHLTISSPGWAKHAWSAVFAPWLAGATVLAHNSSRLAADAFDAAGLIRVMTEHGVSSVCAPPALWQMLAQADLIGLRAPSVEAVALGEPLRPKVIDQVRRACGVTIRDGYGQTGTTLAVGNSPGQPVRVGSMGRAMPGYRVALLDPATGAPADTGDAGEICLQLAAGPIGLQTGRDGYLHTGDLAIRDADGYLTFLGRDDDVFTTSDHRIYPVAVETVLLEHPAVAAVAVLPVPDPVGRTVPKAFVELAEGYHPNRAAARILFEHARDRLAPYQLIRRLEFGALPRTVSGKIRRAELHGSAERGRRDGANPRTDGAVEYRIEDFPS